MTDNRKKGLERFKELLTMWSKFKILTPTDYFLAKMITEWEEEHQDTIYVLSLDTDHWEIPNNDR